MKQVVRRLIRSFGYDIRRYNVRSSDDLKLIRLLQVHGIDMVLDVGAHEGQYGRLLRALGYRGGIISFEPLRVAHAHLLKSSSGDSKWTVAPRVGLGAEEGEADINVASNLWSSSLLPVLSAHVKASPAARTIATESVRLARLDSMVADLLDQDHAEIFLKIDTQGYEEQVLEGAKEVLRRARGVQLELSLVPLYDGQTLFREMLEQMADRGFDLHGLFPGFTNPQSGRLLQVDGVFFRSERGRAQAGGGARASR